jgi:flavin reductase (DIM6/NTAB) family NADH-FMN oxidoreductase RutF
MPARTAKRDFPVVNARQILEPGPVVLVSSAWRGKTDIMTMGWHTMMEFTPSLMGCVIASSNNSFGMILKSGSCVVNVPTYDLADKVVGIGDCSGADTDKFAKFGLTPVPAKKVEAPLIKECFASFECEIADKRLVKTYNFFILKIVKAHVATSPKRPKTLHYHGEGVFSVPGTYLDLHKRFARKQNL